ncbi:MAG: hypothetical protein ABL956_11790 [Hyphomonadaceae bacterium]
MLRVFTKPDQAFLGASAVWTRYHFNCNYPRQAGILARVVIDKAGKIVEETPAKQDESELRMAIYDSMSQETAATVCTFDPPKDVRHSTLGAAITDAAKPQWGRSSSDAAPSGTGPQARGFAAT